MIVAQSRIVSPPAASIAPNLLKNPVIWAFALGR
jgi:hypothetical protein